MRYVAGLLHQDLAHGVALDIHAQDLGGLVFSIVRAISYLHSSGLAPPAGLDLGLDDHPGLAGRGEVRRDRPRLRGRMSDLSRRHRHAVFGEELFGLMLEQVHVPGPSLADACLVSGSPYPVDDHPGYARRWATTA